MSADVVGEGGEDGVVVLEKSAGGILEDVRTNVFGGHGVGVRDASLELGEGLRTCSVWCSM